MPEVTPPASNGHPALKQPAISFEFFPPKTEEMEKSLWETIKRLAPLSPNFVSVTYGAGGSTRERTHSTIARILKETALLPAAHLTCVGAARGEIDDIVGRYHEIGVRHIVALRGDPAGGIGTLYRTASRRLPDLGRTRRRHQARSTATSRSRSPPIRRNIRKAATSMPTSTCCRPRSTRALPAPSPRCSSTTTSTFAISTGSAPAASSIPVVPGIMPMHNFKQARNFVTRAGTTVPGWLAEKFEGLDDDAETRKLVAATVAAGQVRKLAKHGVDTFHFYTMNRADLVFAICHLLGIRPKGAQKAA